jgi:transposase
MNNIKLVAIDLAKETFQVRAEGVNGRLIYNKKISRSELFKHIVQLPQGTTIVMEACGGANYWGRRFEGAGYKVHLIAPQYVKPYVKTHKNDSADAAAIAEAASREGARFIPVKTVMQQDIQAIHRVRERQIKNQTALTNEIRGLLLEYGVAIPKGNKALKRAVPEVLEAPEVTEQIKCLVRDLYEELLLTEKRITTLTQKIKVLCKQINVCSRLLTIPGFGVISATALFAAVGNMKFKNGRALAAFLGLVPRQFSSGKKQRLGRISKNGDVYIRKLLVHGARSVIRVVKPNETTRYRSWATKIKQTKGYSKGAVALAHKNARIAQRLLASDTCVFDGALALA